MDDKIRQSLRRTLVTGYNQLMVRLVSRTGSRVDAEDALQEIWLSLDRVRHFSEVRNEMSYLLTAALNIVRDRRKRESRLSTDDEIIDFPDENPSPEDAELSRSELQAFYAVFGELPERQKLIFFAAWHDELSVGEIAAKYGFSVRMVQRDLVAAREFCARQMKKVKNFCREDRSGESND